MIRSWSIFKKLVVIWISIEIIFLVIVAGGSYLISAKTLEENVRFQFTELAPIINSALTTPLLQKDYASVISITKELASSKSIYELVVLDTKNKVIAKSTNEDASNYLVDSDLIKTKIPLQVGDLNLGFLEIKLSKAQIHETQNSILFSTILIGSVAIFIFMIVAYWLGRYITNPIVLLANFTKNYNNNSILKLEKFNRMDEIGDLYKSYESMLKKIKNQFQELTINQQILMDREELIKDAIDSIPDAFALFDQDDKLILCNQIYIQTFTNFNHLQEVKGLTFRELAKLSLSIKGEVIPSDFSGNADDWIEERIQHHLNPGPRKNLIHFSDGRWFQINERKTKAGGIVGTRTDITALKEAQHNIEKYAFYDPLTQLANRRLVLDRLEQARNTIIRNKVLCAVLIIDIDRFKTVNDSKGHGFGDQILITFARRIESILRNSDTAARLGGDEFLILLTDLGTSPPAALKAVKLIVEKLHKKLSDPYDINSEIYNITPSIGVAFYSDTTASVNDLLKEADLALYEAKKTGRNSIRFFNKRIYDDFMDRIQVESMLNDAIKNNKFVLYYQSQVDQFGKLVSGEALLRWRDNAQGISLPKNFIPIAEDCGLIIPIGSWVLSEACAQLALWRGTPFDHVEIAVNISARQFLDPNFLTTLSQALISSNAKPENLKLEITESIFLLDIDGVIEKLQLIKKLGVKLCIDDFGTGYSSLNYLKLLPVDEIKIDKSFVDRLFSDKGDQSIVSSIIYLARNFSLKVVAEGVENADQLEVLKDLGCKYFQGYYFHKPSSMEDLLASFSPNS